MKMNVGLDLPKTVLVALVVVVVVFLGLLAWVGGELHYGNCLTQAQVEGKTEATCSRWP